MHKARRILGAEDRGGYTGRGIGIAILDTGIAPVEDLAGDGRLAAFCDLVNGRTEPYDDNGHGTHVA